MPHISLATVYRNLDLMARNGLIRKIEGGAQSRYDGMIEVHTTFDAFTAAASKTLLRRTR